jgi:hypothetical protein
MRKILAAALLLVFVAAFVSAGSARFGATGPDWSHLRLGPETMALGALSSVENGYAVFLQEVEGKQTQRVHLYRLPDGPRATLDPLSQVPDANDAVFYDVSVGKSGLVAVAAGAVLKTEPDLIMVGLLLFYDTRGNLVSLQRLLGQGQSIRKLKVDDDDTVWAISHGARSADPTTAPLLYKYTNLGTTVSVLYTRASLPEVNWIKPYVRGIGTVAFATTKESVYCWIPELQETVIMAKNGSGIRRVPLAAPRPAGAVPVPGPTVFRMFFTEGGNAFADVFFEIPSKDPSKPAIPRRAPFVYDEQKAAWRELRYDTLFAVVGVDGERPILMSKWKRMREDSSYELDSSVQLFCPGGTKDISR